MTDVEEHLGVTIPETDSGMKVEASEYDGKVVYGEKRSEKGKFKTAYHNNHRVGVGKV